MTTTGASKSASMFGVLVTIFGIIAVTLSLWASFIVGTLGPKTAVVLLRAEDYRQAIFTIEKLVFVKGRRSPSGKMSSSPNKYWAEGRVEGKAEKFTLGAYVKGIPINQEQLESQVFVGQPLSVLYNPSVPESTDARVLYPKEKFPEYWQKKWKNIFLVGYLPMGSALLLCIVCSFLARSWSGLKFTIASLPIALIGWVFVLSKVL